MRQTAHVSDASTSSTNDRPAAASLAGDMRAPSDADGRWIRIVTASTVRVWANSTDADRHHDRKGENDRWASIERVKTTGRAIDRSKG